MTENILLEIEVKIDYITEIHGENSSVSIVYFSGNASSSFFRGKVMSGAADTQIRYKDKPTTLSARYVLEGVDCFREVGNNQVKLNIRIFFF